MSRLTRKRSRAPRWKRRGRLRARMVARVHLTPIFPTRGSAALSAHRRRRRPGPRSRLCHFFAPSPLFSILEDPKSLRESAWSTAPPEAPTLTLRSRPFNASLRFRVNPTHAPYHSSLPNCYSPRHLFSNVSSHPYTYSCLSYFSFPSFPFHRST